MARKYYKDIDGNPYVLRKKIGRKWHLAELCRHIGTKTYYFGFHFIMTPKKGDLVEIKFSEAFNYIEHEYTWKVTGENRVLIKLNEK